MSDLSEDSNFCSIVQIENFFTSPYNSDWCLRSQFFTVLKNYWLANVLDALNMILEWIENFLDSIKLVFLELF